MLNYQRVPYFWDLTSDLMFNPWRSPGPFPSPRASTAALRPGIAGDAMAIDGPAFGIFGHLGLNFGFTLRHYGTLCICYAKSYAKSVHGLRLPLPAWNC